MAIQDEIPKSRLTLTYRTTINGAMQDISLPFRILVLSDFSLGTSTDRKLDLADRKLRPLAGRNLDPL
ncbi:MAG TPA: type VI secretion system contractile sheath small subunit, partial [Pseudomonadota bacterium]|nr:type VI secretion system contractile sheath small subunit [Pseudomonadota bacterium]